MLTEPLPYHPRLCKLLGGVTISIVLVYLEIHHSQPEPTAGLNPGFAGLKNPPVYVDCDQACEDLGVSRRTLHLSLACLSVWWRLEAQRAAASRSGREFLSQTKSVPALRSGPVRPYSIVGSKEYEQHRILAIHRNLPRLDQLAVDARLLPNRPEVTRFVEDSDTAATGRCVDRPSEVLGNVLDLGPIPRGIAWGWSEERRKAASERMTAKWLKWREIASK